MSILIEFIVGSALAIYSHWAFNSKEAAYIIFGISILLALATYLIREEITKTRRALSNLYQGSQEITEALSAIKDPECQQKSQELVTVFKKNLHLLERGYLLLNEAEFYLEGVKGMEQAVRRVKAVDPLQVGWESRGALLNYYQANLKAHLRGVQITRIFVLSRRDFLDQNVQKLLHQQSQDGIDVRYAYREDLRLKNGTDGTHDFAIYSDAIVTDRGRDDSSYFGKKTKNATEIDKYLYLFDLIEHHSHRLSADNALSQNIALQFN
jgi:hypothetical protein